MTDRSDRAGGDGLLVMGLYADACLGIVLALSDGSIRPLTGAEMRCALLAIQSVASPPSGNAGEGRWRWSDDQIYFAARALALSNPDAYEDKSHKGSLKPNQKATDAACMALGAAIRHGAAPPQPAPDVLQRILCGIVGTPDANGMVTFKVHESVVRQMQAAVQPALDGDVQPDYESAARALGFGQIPSGTWFHPNQSPEFTERFKTAEEIFDRYSGKHWLSKPPPDDGPCFYCGEHTNGLAGDPGLWPLQFCQPDGTGINRFHHVKCVTGRLTQPAPDALREALKPFAALLDTHSNGYESSPDDEVVRSVGTLGRDYAIVTVGDLRRAKSALSTPLPSGEPPSDPNAESRKLGESFGQAVTDAGIGKG